MKTFTDFNDSLSKELPPDTLTPLLQALWWDAKGEWSKAHQIVQDIGNKDAAWVHAYLHRREGDEGNASYWYTRAGKAKPRLSLENERKAIIETLLSQH